MAPETQPQAPQQPPAGGKPGCKPGCTCDGKNCCPCCPCKPKEEPKPEVKPEAKPGIAITQEHLDRIAELIIRKMEENPEQWRGKDGAPGLNGKDGKSPDGEFGFIVEFEGKSGTIKRRVEIGNGGVLTIPPSRLDIYEGDRRYRLEEALGDPLNIEVIGDLEARKEGR